MASNRLPLGILDKTIYSKLAYGKTRAAEANYAEKMTIIFLLYRIVNAMHTFNVSSNTYTIHFYWLNVLHEINRP